MSGYTIVDGALASSPQPSAGAPLHGLRASASERQHAAGWLDGFAIEPDYCDDMTPFDVVPFVIEATVTRDVGAPRIDAAGRARRQLEAATSKLLEVELWTGTQQPGNPVLSTGATVIGDSAAFSPLAGLVLLGQALSNCGQGGRGTIHAPTFIVDTWLHLGLLDVDEDRLVTVVRGDTVVAGTGYPGTGPDGAAIDPGQSWAFATGPVSYRLGEITVDAETVADGVAEHRAERHAVVSFEPCCHYGVLVDLAVS